MLQYIVKRIAYALPVLLGVTVLVFVLISLAPGDPAVVMLGNDATPEAIERMHLG